jgi:hypothetical protein
MLEISASSTPLGKKEAALAACHGDNGKGGEGAIADDMDLSRPFLVVKNLDYKKILEVYYQCCDLPLDLYYLPLVLPLEILSCSGVA